MFYSIPLKQGERIVTCAQEYSANYVAMLQVDDLYIMGQQLEIEYSENNILE